MPNLLRNSILMILLFCRTLLSCLEDEISVKIDFTLYSAIISYQRLNSSDILIQVKISFLDLIEKKLWDDSLFRIWSFIHWIELIPGRLILWMQLDGNTYLREIFLPFPFSGDRWSLEWCLSLKFAFRIFSFSVFVEEITILWLKLSIESSSQ